MMKLPELLLTFAMLLAATATNADVQGDFEYQANEDGTVAVTRYLGSEGEVVIPSALGGKVVTVIEAWAFENCESVTRVTIPDSVTSIGDSAFAGCPNLTSVYFKGDAPEAEGDPFFGSDIVTVFYLAEATGWGETFAGRPTAIWHLDESELSLEQMTVDSAGVHFSILGPAGRTVSVQACTEVATGEWQDMGTYSLDESGTYAFTDPAWADYPSRFYRAVLIEDGGPIPDGMELIPAGSFLMGDSSGGEDGEDWEVWEDELPRHSVFVSGFYMDRFEVTKELWNEVRAWGNDHGYDLMAGEGKGPSHPVHSVSWYDVVKWCNARSEKEGLAPCYYTTESKTIVYRTGEVGLSNDFVLWDANGYRLPTEAEWEKAARGGLEGKRFPWGDTISHSQANYYSNSYFSYDVSPTRGYHPDYDSVGDPYTSPVGSFPPNGDGLHDMAGNVLEWCWDCWYDGWYGQSGAIEPDSKGPNGTATRVMRGGGWNYAPFYVRCACRTGIPPDGRYVDLGFRCARGQF